MWERKVQERSKEVKEKGKGKVSYANHESGAAWVYLSGSTELGH